MQSATLQCLQAVERHFAANIAEVYENLAIDWDISSKLMAVVTNAGNMTVAVVKQHFSTFLVWLIPYS